MDHVIDSGRIVYDIKRAMCAAPDVCAKHAIDYGYVIQWASYTSGLAKLHPELAGRIDFVFVFIETEPPYCVTPLRPDGEMRQIGTVQWERAVMRWEECLRQNNWPKYVQQIEDMHAPAWALARELGSAA